MRILFITTLNLATNPRLYKEIKLALDAGYNAEVVCFEFSNWSRNYNRKLKSELSSATIYSIPGGRFPFLSWLISIVLEFFFRTSAYFFELSDWRLAQAVSRRNILLLKQIKKISKPIDLVIGHHPGAIFACSWAAKRFNCPAAFDIEDYHPGEGKNYHELNLIKKLIVRLLPGMIYTSFASPQILKRTSEDLNSIGKDWFIVFNHFLSTDFTFIEPIQTDTLELVWFSQNINFYRGLEQIIPVLSKFQPHINLTLIGNKKKIFYREYIQDRKFIKVIEPLDQKTLHKIMGNYDVGLAIEPGKDKNNAIALSNKIWTYFQSGLYILASDTPAQADFLSNHSDQCIVIPLREKDISSAFSFLINNLNEIRASKKTRFKKSKNNCWEKESLKLLGKWKEILV